MVFYIVIFLYFIIAWLIIAESMRLSHWDWIGGFIISAFQTALVFGFLSLITALCFFHSGNWSTARQTANIKSIKTESSINGSFFLGSGGFGSSKRYYSYTEYGPGYILQDFPSDSVIVESNSVAPNVSWDLVSPKSRSWLYPDWFLPNPKYRNYQITVPEGTIISEYKLN